MTSVQKHELKLFTLSGHFLFKFCVNIPHIQTSHCINTYTEWEFWLMLTGRIASVGRYPIAEWLLYNESLHTESNAITGVSQCPYLLLKPYRFIHNVSTFFRWFHPLCCLLPPCKRLFILMGCFLMKFKHFINCRIPFCDVFYWESLVWIITMSASVSLSVLSDVFPLFTLYMQG